MWPRVALYLGDPPASAFQMREYRCALPHLDTQCSGSALARPGFTYQQRKTQDLLLLPAPSHAGQSRLSRGAMAASGWRGRVSRGGSAASRPMWSRGPLLRSPHRHSDPVLSRPQGREQAPSHLRRPPMEGAHPTAPSQRCPQRKPQKGQPLGTSRRLLVHRDRENTTAWGRELSQSGRGDLAPAPRFPTKALTPALSPPVSPAQGTASHAQVTPAHRRPPPVP